MNSVEKALSSELHAVALRGVERVYDESLPVLGLPVLRDVLQSLHPLDSASPSVPESTRRLRLTLDAIIASLPDDPMRESTASLRWIAHQLFESEHSVDGKDSGKHYDNRLRYVRQSGRISPTVRSDRLTGLVREAMAKQLLSWRTRSLAPRGATHESSTGYVSRLKLEKSILSIVSEGVRLIVLHGDAGTGKSRLAETVAGIIAPGKEQVRVVNCGDDDSLVADLAQHLGLVQAPTGEGLGVISRRFALSLVNPPVPGVVVVLDNVISERQCRLLLPGRAGDRLQSTVLVTSHLKLMDHERGVRHIRVDNASPEEGAAMVALRVPDLGSGEAYQLSEVLDHRPLAIAHGSALLRTISPRPDVDMFRDMLQSDMVGLIDSAPGERKLTAIYRDLLAELRSNEAYGAATRVLEMLLFLGVHTPEAVVVRSWRTGAGSRDRLRVAIDRHIVAEAANTLERLGLISFAGRDPEARVIKMHRLTHQILNTLWSASYESTFESFVASFALFLAEIEWEPGTEIGEDLSCDMIHFLAPFREWLGKQSGRLEVPLGQEGRWAYPVLCALQLENRLDGRCMQPLRDLVLSLARPGSEVLGSGRPGTEVLATLIEGGHLVDRYLEFESRPIPPWRFYSSLGAESDLYSGEFVHIAEYIHSRIIGNGLNASETGSAPEEAPGFLRHLRIADSMAARGNWSDAEAEILASLSSGPEVRGSAREVSCVLRGLRVAAQAGDEAFAARWIDQAEAISAGAWSHGPVVGLRLGAAHQVAVFSRLTRRMMGASAVEISDATASMREWYRSALVLSKKLSRPTLTRLLAYDAARVNGFFFPCSVAEVIREFHFGESGEGHPVDSDWGVNPICYLALIEEAKYVIAHWLSHGSQADASLADEVVLQAKRMLVVSRMKSERGDGVGLSAYQRLDAAVAGLALSLFVDRAPRRLVRGLSREARRLGELIGRMDRVVLAERVGRGEAEFAWLHAW